MTRKEEVEEEKWCRKDKQYNKQKECSWGHRRRTQSMTVNILKHKLLVQRHQANHKLTGFSKTGWFLQTVRLANTSMAP